ncbi:hypothetical protein NC652_031003 [Populus alba x Populus x berolinensis]|nr:hypothetical protein NC652_031003 [Populus alba x Populus x berolinensis]
MIVTHQSSTVIIKSNNILLDANVEARIADYRIWIYSEGVVHLELLNRKNATKTLHMKNLRHC